MPAYLPAKNRCSIFCESYLAKLLNKFFKHPYTLYSSRKYSQREIGLFQFSSYHYDIEDSIGEVSKHLFYIFPTSIEIRLSVQFCRTLRNLFSYEHLQNIDVLTLLGSIMLQNVLEKIFSRVKIRRKLWVEPETDDEYPILQVIFDLKK